MSCSILRMVDPEMTPYEFAKRVASAFFLWPKALLEEELNRPCWRTSCSTIFSLAIRADGKATCLNSASKSRGLQKALTPCQSPTSKPAQHRGHPSRLSGIEPSNKGGGTHLAVGESLRRGVIVRL